MILTKKHIKDIHVNVIIAFKFLDFLFGKTNQQQNFLKEMYFRSVCNVIKFNNKEVVNPIVFGWLRFTF